MSLDSLRRRSYLGGIVAAVTGLAGCGSDGDEDAQPTTDATEATNTATDTTDSTATQTDLPPHDHSGPERGGAALAPDRLSNATVAEPGEVQSAIDDAAGRVDDPRIDSEVVALLPGTEYDEGAELHVKPGVTLDCRGAVFTPSGDYDVLFMDQCSRALAPRVIVPDGMEYHSTVLTLDADRTSGVPAVSGENGYTSGEYAYDGMVGTHAAVLDMELQAPSVPSPESLTAESTALHCKTGTASEDASESLPGTELRYIQEFRITGRINGFQTGVHLEAHGQNWINGVEFHLTPLSNQTLGTQILHTGSQPARSDVFGQLQPSPRTRYGIRNETGVGSVTYHGRMWDQFDYRRSTVKGKNVQIAANPGEITNVTESDESSVFTLFENRSFAVKNGDGDQFRVQPDDDAVKFWADGSDGDGQKWQLGYDGHLQPIDANPSRGSMGLAEFDDPSDAPANTLFWDSTREAMRYRTPEGDLRDVNLE